MKLYIQVVSGKPINHPADEENLLAAFGSVPSDWELFERVERPHVGVYQVLENDAPSYRKFDAVWKEVWLLREMTDSEITAKQQAVKAAWAADLQAENWATWLFSETHCEYYPPTPYPGLPNYKWCGSENKWKEAPLQPTTGGPYKFDYSQWIWLAV